MKKSFLILVTIALGFGVAFWIRQLYRPELPDVPETIIVGTSADFPPMAFKKDNAIVGFDIDVVTEAVSRIGKKMVLKDMPFELLMPQVQMGTIHVIAAGMSITPERAKRVDFTQPYLTVNPLIVISLANQPKIDTIDDLRNKRIIVNQGYTADLYMSKLDNIALTRLPAVADALLALRSGRADAFVTEASTARPIFEQYGQENFNIFMIEDTNENSAIVISKQYPELTQQLSTALEQMEQDGTLQKLKQKWHVQ